MVVLITKNQEMKSYNLINILNYSRQYATKILLLVITTFGLVFSNSQSASAYPFWAQQVAPETPREATGKIVCANCHLAQKKAEVEIPHSVLPDTVFEAVVKIPYDLKSQQVLADGSRGGLNVGAVLMLPDGFTIAPAERIPEEMKDKIADVYYQSYREGYDNVVLVGPLPGEQHQEIVFPILSPNPAENKSIHFGKYAVHLGANRGRGQVYPTGELSNNNGFKASASGSIDSITPVAAGGYEVVISTENGKVTDTIPAGPALVVQEGQEITAGSLLTENPNVGGFGQKDTEIVLQNPSRILAMAVFAAGIMLAQVMLVIKKKQIERVQAAETVI